jgi:hypothetical protein
MIGYSTREAAKKLGLALSSLTKYITLKLIPIPPLTRVGGVRVRLWSETDLEHVRQLLPKIANGRKTRYKKKQSAKTKKKAQARVPAPHKKK